MCLSGNVLVRVVTGLDMRLPESQAHVKPRLTHPSPVFIHDSGLCSNLRNLASQSLSVMCFVHLFKLAQPQPESCAKKVGVRWAGQTGFSGN